jgi:hypothetical protein
VQRQERIQKKIQEFKERGGDAMVAEEEEDE